MRVELRRRVASAPTLADRRELTEVEQLVSNHTADRALYAAMARVIFR
ncbi:hypothetical protein J0H58_38420 [bacterium]|nr:hypothetical protein [bacterium]